MGKNKNFTQDEKSKILALYIELNSYAAVARKMGLTRKWPYFLSCSSPYGF